jgi:hypothetical protein
VVEEPSDVPPCDDSEEDQAEWEQAQAAWAAMGFPGCAPAFPVERDEPRQVDPGSVIVEPDEVKTKAQPTTGRQEVWTDTAVVLVAGMRYASRKRRRRACGCKWGPDSWSWESSGLLPISWSSDNGSQWCVCSVDKGSVESSSIDTYLAHVTANSAGVL